jgi:Calcium-binding EGF domain
MLFVLTPLAATPAHAKKTTPEIHTKDVLVCDFQLCYIVKYSIDKFSIIYSMLNFKAPFKNHMTFKIFFNKFSDIDECQVFERPCGSNAICENAAPGYNCLCPQGYAAKPSPDVACEQVDVNILCQSNFDCVNNAECIETQCFCLEGFVAQGAICVDIDECAANPCGPFASCQNTAGGFHCECEAGYVGAPPTMQCKAPCDEVKCGKHAFCKPDGQEAYCICEEGWTYNPSDIAAGCIGKLN